MLLEILRTKFAGEPVEIVIHEDEVIIRKIKKK